MEPTMQFRWVHKLSLTSMPGVPGKYKIWEDAHGKHDANSTPVLQRLYYGWGGPGGEWIDVPVVEETREEAQARCDALNARRDANKKDGGV